MISSENFRKQYNGNNLTTVFPYDFKITDESQLNVIVTNSSGNESTLILDTDYTVSGVGEEAGGNVTYPISGSPLPVGSIITIRRILPLKQLIDLTNQTAFQAQTLEEMVDNTIMICQQLKEEINRCLRSSISDETDLELPSVNARKNSYLGFDANGQFAIKLDAPASAEAAALSALAAQTAQAGSEAACTDAELAAGAAEEALETIEGLELVKKVNNISPDAEGNIDQSEDGVIIGMINDRMIKLQPPTTANDTSEHQATSDIVITASIQIASTTPSTDLVGIRWGATAGANTYTVSSAVADAGQSGRWYTVTALIPKNYYYSVFYSIAGGQELGRQWVIIPLKGDMA